MMAGCSQESVSASLPVKSERHQALAEEQRLRQELLQGLMQEHKSINPKFFYDERGSQLFEQIMGLPEYYPSRTELSILEQFKTDIASHLGKQQVLIEPGAGNCEKVKTLLPALQPKCYIPVDISAEFLIEAASRLQADFPSIDVQAVAGDMHMRYPIPRNYLGLRKVVFYPGSTIGNYEPDQALLFLQQLHQQLDAGDGLLIGVDLQKPADILHSAYNDRQGVTALFNLNILNHVNALADADFDIANFAHVAFYNSTFHRIEMHLESTVEHNVSLNDHRIGFRRGERIHTEYSYKYSLDSFDRLAKEAGFSRQAVWLDDNSWFSLQYFER